MQKIIISIFFDFSFISFSVIGSKAKAEICLNLAERLSENQLNIEKLRDEISAIPSRSVVPIVKGAFFSIQILFLFLPKQRKL